MKIVATRVLRGPNRWSGYRRKLVEIKLDLEDLEEKPTDRIPGFAERIEKTLPSLYEHECSEKRPGGFFERVRRGTWMGHVIEHIALELQSLAGMPCGYGRTRSAGTKGVYYVVFAYEIRSAGLYAGKAALSVVEQLVNGEIPDILPYVTELKKIREAEGFSSFTTALVEEANRRNIPLQARENNDLLVFGQGVKTRVVPLKNGHPCYPSIDIRDLFRDLNDNGIPAVDEKEAGWEKFYQFFIVKGKLLAASPTPKVHRANIFLAERVARLTGLDYCTVTLRSKDITLPYNRNDAAVTDIYPGPPQNWSKGEEKMMAEKMLETLFPPGTNGRIPLVAVTGTNGKTTTTRLIAHMARTEGHFVGYTNTDGIYIEDVCINKGDCSGPTSAEIILRDPFVEFAVLECARGGIIRSGLGFDKCDVSVITNVTGDHLGVDGIRTNEDLARVKAVVAYATSDQGFAVLNSEDDLVYGLKKDLDCNIALFGMQMNDRLKRHMHLGGLAAFVEDGNFVVCWHGCRSEIGRIEDTPLTHQGRAECMIRNILPCLCVAMIKNFSIASIREALQTFVPGPKYTPGRMNLFQFPRYDVMVDYAHNPDGYREMWKFMKHTEASRKIGIIACPGDRLDQDLRSMGYMAAQMFDEIIIRHDRDGRGRTNEEITKLVLEGIAGAETQSNVTVISDELDALQYAMNHAPEGAIIVTLTEDAASIIAFIESRLALNPVGVSQAAVA